MRHQRNDRHDNRSERNNNDRSQNRSQGRSQGQFGGYQGQSYRNDDYDMGSREYQGLGSSSQTSRDQNQGYSSSYGSRDLDFGSGQSSYNDNSNNSGWGRGASEEESSMYGSRDSQRSGGFGSGMGFQGAGFIGGQGTSSQSYGAHQDFGGGSGSRQNYGSDGSYGSQQDRSESKGRFMGRGPKGYKRSDDRIKEEVCDMLTRDSDVDASDIDIEVKEGEVTLTGFVPERKMKHQAEDLVEKCMGVKDVTNNLRVRREDSRGESRESSQSESDTDRNEKRSSSSSASGTTGQTASSKKGGSSSTTTNPH